MRRDPRWLAVVSVLAVAVTVGWAAAVRPAPVKAAPDVATVVPIRHATLLCPQAGGGRAGAPATIGYADATPPTSGAVTTPAAPASGAPASGAASGSASPLRAGPLDPVATPLTVTPRDGHAWTATGPSEPQAIRVDVNGPLADTLSAVQVTHSAPNHVAQLAASPCRTPTTDAWFVGYSSAVGAHASLLIGNVDPVPATVNVSVYGDQTPPDENADHGVTIAPDTQTVIALDQIEPGLNNAAVHVSASAGRVVAALRFDNANGSVPLGVDWLPTTAAPATDLTVPGFLAGQGIRSLVVANPGELDGSIALTVVNADGSFTPDGAAAISVAAGQVRAIDLAPMLQNEAATVLLKSTVPVVVGGESALPADKAGATDFAFTAAVSALSGPVVVAGGATSKSQVTTLVLTAPDADANLDVMVLPSAASSDPSDRHVTVPAGTTVAMDLGGIAKDPAPGVVLTPGKGGAVYGAWVLRETVGDGGDVTEIPLQTPVRTLSRPSARTDVRAALPGLPGPVGPPGTG